MGFLSIDVGTTGVKTAVFSNDGSKLASSYWEYERPQGSTEYNGEEIWEHLKRMIPLTVNEGNVPITAVGVCSQGEGFAPVDKDGKAIYPFLQNTDQRGAQFIEGIPPRYKERIRKNNWLEPLPRYALAKMIYIHEKEKEVFSNLWKYMLFEDYIIFKLTGEAVSDTSISTRTNAFDHYSKRYDNMLLLLAGIDDTYMPRLQHIGTIAGAVNGKLAEELHVSSGTPVVLCGHDCIPENLASGVINEEIASLGCGTAEGIGFLRESSRINGEDIIGSNLGCEEYAVSGYNILFGFNANSGSLIKWYRDEFGTPLGMGYPEMNKRLPKDPTGILTVPHFSGSSTPDFVREAKGTITGLRYYHTPFHIYKSCMEGTAYEMRYILEKIGKMASNIKEIRVSGGGAKSKEWLQIKADILGIPIIPLKNKDTTLAGCAIIAGVATGVYADYKEGVNQFVKTDSQIEPDEKNKNRYSELFMQYKTVRTVLTAAWQNV